MHACYTGAEILMLEAILEASVQARSFVHKKRRQARAEAERLRLQYQRMLAAQASITATGNPTVDQDDVQSARLPVQQPTVDITTWSVNELFKAVTATRRNGLTIDEASILACNNNRQRLAGLLLRSGFEAHMINPPSPPRPVVNSTPNHSGGLSHSHTHFHCTSKLGFEYGHSRVLGTRVCAAGHSTGQTTNTGRVL